MGEYKPSCEPAVHRCDWDGGWHQYHDELDPLPAAWDDEAPTITPLYTAAQLAAELERAQTDAYAEGRKDEAEEARKFLRPRFARMLEALDALVSMCEVHGDFSNGVTDPAGSIDEGVVRASELIRAGRAAIASIRTTGESTDA